MKRMIFAIFALLATSAIAHTPTVECTAAGGGYYRVTVDGVQISQHVADREAAISAANAELANPDAVTEYTHDYRVRCQARYPAEPEQPPTDTPADPPADEPPTPPSVDEGQVLLIDDSSTWRLPARVDMSLPDVSWGVRAREYTDTFPSGGWQGRPFARLWPRPTEGFHGIGLARIDFGSANPGVDTYSVRILIRFGPTGADGFANGWKFIGFTNGNFCSYTTSRPSASNDSGHRRWIHGSGTYAQNDFPGPNHGFLEWPPIAYNVVVHGDQSEARTPGARDGATVGEWVLLEYIVSPTRAQLYNWTADGAYNGLAFDDSVGPFAPINHIEGVLFYSNSGTAIDNGSYIDIGGIWISEGNFGNPVGPPAGYLLH